MKKFSLKKLIEIKNKFGTPTYLYSLDRIKQQYYTIRNPLSNTCKIFYSMKANPLLAICQCFSTLRAGCEVSSKNELLTAVAAGFNPGDIIFVGPGKTNQEIELCVQKKIKAIICESIDEVLMVNKIAQSCSIMTNVMIRINPSFSINDAPIKMSGVATQFGMELPQFKENYPKIQSCKKINLCGIQIYNGSRILNEGAIVSNVKNILECAEQLSQFCNTQWQYIDIGGGFGVPYFKNESNLNIKKVITAVNHLFKKYNLSYPKTTFILELGRYLVAESGVLIGSVIATKFNHGKNFVTIDSGMQCHFSSTGLSSFVQRNFPANHVSLTCADKRKLIYQITGPLCTPGDVILRDVEFSKISEGDFIILLNVGAYGYTASPIRFISHDTPAEVVLLNKKMYLARKRDSFLELLSRQNDLSEIF